MGEPLCMPPSSWEERVLIVRRHFERKGYRVHSGLQFGCELVLYADTPDRVHSDFCVHVVPPDGSLDWKLMQSLVRSMPDLHKTLILANIVPASSSPSSSTTTTKTNNKKGNEQENAIVVDAIGVDDQKWEIQELAIATEHAPFRHKKPVVEVGGQRKNTNNNNNKRPKLS